jgi:hypothetical protein
MSAYVAVPISHLVSVEMVESPLSTLRMRTNVAMMWIEAVINVAVEAMRAVEPRAGSDKHAAVEPLRPVIAVWGAVIWREVVVAIRASRLRSDIDRYLGGRRARHQQSCHQGRKSKEFPIAHEFLLAPEKAINMPKLQDWEAAENSQVYVELTP